MQAEKARKLQIFIYEIRQNVIPLLFAIESSRKREVNNSA